MLSRTYVVLEAGVVIAYYTLAHIDVQQADVPKKFGRGMPSSIPSMLMGRFAVDRHHMGKGLGRGLFIDALSRTWAAMRFGPAPMRLFVVDAKDDEAKKFYEHFNMVPSPVSPMRLILSYKSLSELFDAE